MTTVTMLTLTKAATLGLRTRRRIQRCSGNQKMVRMAAQVKGVRKERTIRKARKTTSPIKTYIEMRWKSCACVGRRIYA
jgi:hypothetical protein